LERADFALLPLSFSFSNPISTHIPLSFFPPSQKGGKEEREGEERRNIWKKMEKAEEQEMKKTPNESPNADPPL